MQWLWSLLELVGIQWKRKQASDAAASIPSIDTGIDAAKKSADSIQHEIDKPPLQ